MKKKLLLADDSVTIQKVVQITFSHDDYELTVVDNGDIAYEKARLQRPDLILADVFMPGKNGYELCAAIKNDPLLATVPVLLLTGTFEPFDEAKAKAVGADRWIAKPFESQALIACVEELLKQAVQTPVPVPPLAPSSPVALALAQDEGDFAPPDLSSDLPDDIWGSEFSPESIAANSAPELADSFAPVNQDDLWDVSGFESDGQAAEADDLWGGDFEATAVPAPVASSSPVRGAVDPWEEDDFSTSFATAIDAPAPVAFASSGAAEFPLADDIEILEEIDLLEPVAIDSGNVEIDSPFAPEDFSFSEPPQPAAVLPLPNIPAPAVVSPVALAAAAPTSPEGDPMVSGSLPQLSALSSEQLELMVERVAAVVISRLSGTLLEKIAWEVVPDLAETMIKEELRKLREAVAAE